MKLSTPLFLSIALLSGIVLISQHAVAAAAATADTLDQFKFLNESLINLNNESESNLVNSNSIRAILKKIDNSVSFENRCIIKKVKSQFDADGGGRASCGYHALKNGILIARAILNNSDVQKELTDSAIINSKFGNTAASWRNHVINFRATECAKSSLKQYLETQLSKDTKILSAQELPIISNLITNISSVLANNNYSAADNIRNYKIAAETIYKTIEGVIFQRAKDEPSNTFYSSVTRTKITQYFPKLGDLTFSIGDGAVLTCGKDVSNKKWNDNIAKRGPNDTEIPGEWLSSAELKSIVEHERASKSGLFENYQANDIPVFFIDNIDGQIELEKDLKDFATKMQTTESSGLAVFIVYLPAHWVACVAYKDSNQKPRYILADSAGDKITTNATIVNLIETLEGQKKVEIDGAINNEYFSSLSGLKDEDLPSIEMLFNDEIPRIIQCLLAPAPKNPHPVNLTNWFVFNGPSGTGKSTLATIIGRRLGREIIYTSGSMRTKYQGSTKELLDQLFAYAKSKKKPVVIIIDEIEAAAHDIGDKSTSGEDLRSGKALLTMMDKYLYDPNILVLCTSNYINLIDKSFRTRVQLVSLPAPNYTNRHRMIRFYLEKAKVDYENLKAQTSVTPGFIEELATATNNLTGRSIQAIINKAVAYYDKGITPRNIDYSFTHNTCDIKNRPVSTFSLWGILWFHNIIGVNYLLARWSSTLEKLIFTTFREEQENLK